MKNAKVYSTFLAVLLMMTLLSSSSLTAYAVSKNPSFGSAIGSFTLYANDSVYDYRIVNIPINNYKNGYNFYATSGNSSIVKVEKASVNSKTGVTFTAKASQHLGKAVITVTMKNSSKKVVQTKKITVTVAARSMPVPYSLRCSSSSGSSLGFVFSVSDSPYVTGYFIQISTSSSFTNNTTDNHRLNSKSARSFRLSNLKSGSRYFIRIASFSNRNGCELISGFSNVVRAITKG